MKLLYEELFKEVKKCKTNEELNKILEKIVNQEIEIIDKPKRKVKKVRK